MFKPYKLLENVLIEIENGIKDGINIDELAEIYSISSTHLRRLFKFAFNQRLRVSNIVCSNLQPHL
jgi:transcriptional regulator GlxA family with amidase domain